MAVFNVNGGKGRDNITLTGTPGDDVFNVRGGRRADNITIDGKGGNDVYNVRGGRGRDNVTIASNPAATPSTSGAPTPPSSGSPTPSSSGTPTPPSSPNAGTASAPSNAHPPSCGSQLDPKELQMLFSLLESNPQQLLDALKKIDPERAQQLIGQLSQAPSPAV